MRAPPKTPVTYNARDYTVLAQPPNSRGMQRTIVIRAERYQGRLFVHVRERYQDGWGPSGTPTWKFGRGVSFHPTEYDGKGNAVAALDQIINGLILLREDYERGLLGPDVDAAPDAAVDAQATVELP